MIVDKISCANAILEAYFTKQGFRADVIKVMAPPLLPKINKSAVSMLLNFVSTAPELSVERALEIIWPAMEKMTLLVDEANEHNVGGAEEKDHPEPTAVANTRAPVVIEQDTDYLVEYDRVQTRSLYPDRSPPPENIDLHLDMTLKTGMFRVLASGKTPPALDEHRIYHLTTPLSSGHAYMSLRGPTLNTQMDLVSYICITHWLGRLSKERFEQAIVKPIRMTIERFFSPIPEDMRPSDYLLDKKIVDSLARLKSVALLFYPTLDDADETSRKRSVMIANIVGTLRLEPDGTIEISPTPELRTLYLSTKKLVPINRSAVIQLNSQMARLLALWIAARPGKLMGRRVFLNLRPMTVLELLREIHPRETGRHNHNDRRQLSLALNELLSAGLIDVDIKYRNVKSKESDERLTLSTEIHFKSHSIGDARSVANSDLTLPVIDVPRKRGRGKAYSTEVAEELQGLSFTASSTSPSARTKPKEWLSANLDAVERIMSGLRKAAKKSPAGARLLLKGGDDRKLTSLAKVFESVARDADAALLRQIASHDPRKSKQSEFETILRSIPLKPAHLRVTFWYRDNADTIARLKKMLSSSRSPLEVAAQIHKRVYFSRLVTPLIAVGRTDDANFFSGTWEAGRESIESNKRDDWNRAAAGSRRKKVMKL